MRTFLCLAAVVVVVVTSASRVSAGGELFTGGGPVEQGKYLVEHVARCPECHTPRTESGELDRSKWMKGATLVTLPVTSPNDWHRKSPDLSSTSPLWMRWGQQGVAKFLQTARNPHGNQAEPPMPSYTLDAADAEAIVAYLTSLP